MRRMSRGVFEFRTPPSWFGRLGSEIRLMNEQGRIHELRMYTAETMIGAQGSYDEEQYRISCRVFGPTGGSVWDRGYELTRPVEAFELKIGFMERMYGKMCDRLDGYVSVRFDRGMDFDAREYVQRVFEASGWQTVPAWTFLVKAASSGYVVYIRRFFLDSFKRGKDILNYIRMMEAVRRDRELAKRKNKNDCYNRRRR